MYLSYDKYTDMGGEMSAALYPRLEMKARKMIDNAVHGRLDGETQVRDAVKFCVFDLINTLDADESSGGCGREIAGMSNDGISVSYAAGGSLHARCMNLIRAWLSDETDINGTPLLYAGVDA